MRTVINAGTGAGPELLVDTHHRFLDLGLNRLGMSASAPLKAVLPSRAHGGLPDGRNVRSDGRLRWREGLRRVTPVVYVRVDDGCREADGHNMEIGEPAIRRGGLETLRPPHVSETDVFLR